MIKKTAVYGTDIDKYILVNLGNHKDLFIKSLYEHLMRLYKDYKGAYWVHYELSNSGFFLAPELHDELTLTGGKIVISADSLGCSISLMMIDELSFKDVKMAENLYKLRAYAYEQEDAELIFNLTDPNF